MLLCTPRRLVWAIYIMGMLFIAAGILAKGLK